MNTVTDYYTATASQRGDMLAQIGHGRRRAAASRPPIVHTHRKPVIITAQMIFEHRARLAARTTPNTHRGEPRPLVDELRLNNITAGRTHE